MARTIDSRHIGNPDSPAVVDVPVGKGHVVFFAINPMWRQQTLGSFFLLFNAALNYTSLDIGRPSPSAEPAKK